MTRVIRVVACAVSLSASLLLLVSPTLAQQYEPTLPREGGQHIREHGGAVAWNVTWPKGISTGMREHPWDQVSIVLAEGAVKVTKPDGTSSIEYLPVGRVRFESKGTVQAEEGVSEIPAHAIIFQLKTPYEPQRWPTISGVPCKLHEPGWLNSLKQAISLCGTRTGWLVCRTCATCTVSSPLPSFSKAVNFVGFSDEGQRGPIAEREAAMCFRKLRSLKLRIQRSLSKDLFALCGLNSSDDNSGECASSNQRRPMSLYCKRDCWPVDRPVRRM